MTTRIFRLAALLAALPFTAIAQTNAPGAHFVENWDIDGDGVATLAELTEKRGDVFYMFDQNEDGNLDAAEYDLFDETRQADMDTNAGGHGQGRMKKVGAGMEREFNDTDGDGLVSEVEFLEHTGAWMDLIDTNGDGAVTTADFGPQGG